MTLFTASFWWVWGPIALLCFIGLVNNRNSSRWFPVFWSPLLVLCLIGATVFLKSCGAGPKDGPSGLVILFAVFPTLIASSLSFIGAYFLMINRPSPEAWCLPSVLGAVLLSGTAIALSVNNVTTSLEVTVLDGDGRHVPNMSIELMISDHMSEKSRSSARTTAEGIAHLRVWPHKYLELKVSNPGGYDSRAVLGMSGWGDEQKVWQHSWGKSSRSYFGLGCAFLDDDPRGNKLTVYLRNEGELVLPAVADRLRTSFEQLESHPLSRHILAGMGRTFESFAHTETLGRIARNNSPLSRAAVQSLVEQAELLSELRRTHRNEFQILVIGGTSTGVLVERLLDAAKPMLGMEDTTAGVYGELGALARHRLSDLAAAQRSATPRARQMIEDAKSSIERSK